MLKIILFIGITLGLGLNVKAQDTSAYEIQRAKINALLADRSSKFGQYDESLNARTGIFGFQTKRDIKNSNEILRQIALNDNEIFRELKVLLDYKDIQYQQVQTSANATSDRIMGYKKAIKDLQETNANLTSTVNKLDKTKDFLTLLTVILAASCAVLAYLLFVKRRTVKSL